MYWIPIFAIPAAVALFQLGALTVWVSVLSAALAGTTAVIVAGIAWELVRRFRRT